ncbi:MAG: family 43 glycosylhydrolase, partial [Acidimicrobiales bacterium]
MHDRLAHLFNGRQRYLIAASVTASLLVGGLAVVVAPESPASATAVVPVVSPSSTPALALDAPDPDVVLAGGTFYAFTTGTTWGNQIAIAKSTFSDPQLGWTTLNGQQSGSSAFAENGDAAPPAPWELNNTATSPGVFQYDGKWIMFYDAEERSSGYYCISVATASSVAGPYVDTSSGPLECQTSFGGSIDPQPFVDPTTGSPYLLWKSNDGSNSGASSVWSAPIASDGVSLSGSPTAIFTIASVPYPWQNTTDDPAMAYAGGNYYLFFSGGNYLSSNYATGYVVCSGPSGPCDQNEPSDPILT